MLRENKIVWMTGIFILALLLRISALVGLPLKMVSDDDFQYHYIAQNINAAIRGEELEDKKMFLEYATVRGWGYPIFLAGVYSVFESRAGYARLIQCIIDSISCLLIFCIGKNFFNEKIGFTAALTASLYPSFIYHSTLLYQETTTIFLILLYVFFMDKACAQKKISLFFVSGILLTILSFYRSGFILLPLVIVPVLVLILKHLYTKNYVHFFASFVAGATFMFVLYGSFIYVLTGSLTLNKPAVAWSFYETLHRDGWISDTFAPTATKELIEVAQEHSFTIPEDGNVSNLSSKVYLIAGLRIIQANPIAFMLQFIKRFNRMWTYVVTYPGRWHDKHVWVQQVFHRCIVNLALFEVPLSFCFRLWPRYLFFLFLNAVYIPIVGNPRYALPAMPFVII